MGEINIDGFEDLDAFKEDLDGYDDFEDYMSYDEDDEFEEPEVKAPTDKANIDMLENQKKFLESHKKLQSMSDKIDAKQHELFPDKKNYRSLILEYFTPELCIELERVVRNFSIDNNTKMKEITKRLEKYNVPFSKLGGGTNRCGLMIDGYAVKIAYDYDGMVDNKREFIYSLALQPYVVKTYECSETGLISVCEYVLSFTESEMLERKNQARMREILKEISSQFFIGDVGITTKNYGNWGTRRDTGELVILDYAYIYSVAFKQFQCSCAGQGTLYYDREFVNLICPICGKKYTFAQLRKKISKKDQQKEIGDILEKGYVLNSQNEMKEFNHKFVLDATSMIRKKIEKDEKKKEREALYESHKKESDLDIEDGYSKSVEEILKEEKSHVKKSEK